VLPSSTVDQAANWSCSHRAARLKSGAREIGTLGSAVPDVKTSRKLSFLDTKPACIAGVLIAFPNLSAR
jgi:hypothetical protein